MIEKKQSEVTIKATSTSKVQTIVLKKVRNVRYVNFKKALKRAILQHKIIFIKVRSTTCKYCDELDAVIASNDKVKNILNKYFEVVKVNTDYDDLPIDVRINSTPTLLFLKPNSTILLMHLTGIRALGEFYSILQELVDDGHSGGYLKL